MDRKVKVLYLIEIILSKVITFVYSSNNYGNFSNDDINNNKMENTVPFLIKNPS